jgi:hypothetical protein
MDWRSTTIDGRRANIDATLQRVDVVDQGSMRLAALFAVIICFSG